MIRKEYEMDDNDHRPDAHLPDIPHMIRSIQRIEGVADCFGRFAGDCNPSSCRWYKLCCKASAKPLKKL
ncbi:hypothetical protein B2D07_07560 [Desulfococcus multivorans]|nr:conserved uncharacterized protein [Desulfococcus multivorans]AQV00642.1 hypothetical protein B2D07_07560 [Desulfococcus multivorans]